VAPYVVLLQNLNDVLQNIVKFKSGSRCKWLEIGCWLVGKTSLSLKLLVEFNVEQ
jgi:hypothetical protein